jgi:hypothetical protein
MLPFGPRQSEADGTSSGLAGTTLMTYRVGKRER